MEYNGRTKLEFALLNISHSITLIQELIINREIIFNAYDSHIIDNNIDNIIFNAENIVEIMDNTQYLTAEDHELMQYEADKHLEYADD